MFLEYEKPFVEIIDFLALERLATNREQIEARDSVAGNEGGIIGGPSLSEGAEEEW